MNKTIIFSLIVLLFSFAGFAQPTLNDQRTTETKIADLLMKLPAQSSADLDKIMAELVALGEPAITKVSANLVAPGQGDDVALRYAISGIVKYVSKGGNTEQMKNCSSALCKSIENAKNEEVKDFLLQELQYVAGDEAVSTVSNYLLNKRLCDPASRVLVRINTDLSNKALADAFPKAELQQQIIVAEAIGKTRYLPAAELLRKASTSTDPNLKKAVLRSLAEIGDLQSAALLAAEAEKVSYTYEKTDATASYLLLVKRVAENGNKPFAEKESKKLFKNTAIPVQTRSTALKIYDEVVSEKAIPELMKALDSQDKEYRMASLSIMGNQLSPELVTDLLKKAKSTKNPDLKAELITKLADYGDAKVIDFIFASLQDKNRQVQMAAIPAAAIVAKSNSVTPLMNVMATGDEEIIAATKNALLTIGGETVADAAANALSNATNTVKIALIEIIAKRQASQHAGLVFNEAENSDPKVRLAAAQALHFLVKAGDAEKIAGLLNKASEENEIVALQDAMFAAVKTAGKKSEQTASVLGLMKKSGKPANYYNVFAKIGGKEALAIVEKEFGTGTGEQKDQVLKAITKWSDDSALDALYRISKNNTGDIRDMALSSFISGINKSENTTDQKVLMFRNAMSLTGYDKQKKMVLEGISKNSILLSLVFVSKYLDDSNLQQTAVQSVNNILLANTGLYGSVIEQIAQKAISLNKDSEADYQKQALLKHLASLPKEEGFVPMFNGKDLTGWKGLVGNPVTRAKMKPKALAEEQKKADIQAIGSWVVENGDLVFTGKGDNLCSAKDYGDFELYVDWKLFPGKEPDAGIYLRGTPQVQIWDTARVNVGAQVGSGGLYNNQKNMSKPLMVADNAVDEWNSFHIKMVGEKVTVFLNGQLVVNNVPLENYWDRNQSIFPTGSIELQAHGSKVAYRDIYVREIPKAEPYKVSSEEAQEGFVPMFNGMNMEGWTGNTTDYFAQEGILVYQPVGEGARNCFTANEYGDFIMRFEFQLTPGANNGLGIRAPLKGDAAYVGMELQILDNEAEIYKDLQPYQYHGSVYGIIPAKRGYLKPVGEWNYQEVMAVGNHIKVTLNGEVILDGDIAKASKNGAEPSDHKDHPGLLNKAGHIGFLGHGSPLKFRNLRIRNMGN
jgi:HEAT repeat protein